MMTFFHFDSCAIILSLTNFGLFNYSQLDLSENWTLTFADSVTITQIYDVGAERETRRRPMKSGSTQSFDWRA
jgi:hypothetical protein